SDHAATAAYYARSLHDALPIWWGALGRSAAMATTEPKVRRTLHFRFTMPSGDPAQLLSFVNASKPFYEMFGGTEVRLMQNVDDPDRKSTRLNSSHQIISYAVFC